jgi:hypothetical protein
VLDAKAPPAKQADADDEFAEDSFGEADEGIFQDIGSGLSSAFNYTKDKVKKVFNKGNDNKENSAPADDISKIVKKVSTEGISFATLHAVLQMASKSSNQVQVGQFLNFFKSAYPAVGREDLNKIM